MPSRKKRLEMFRKDEAIDGPRQDLASDVQLPVIDDRIELLHLIGKQPCKLPTLPSYPQRPPALHHSLLAR